MSPETLFFPLPTPDTLDLRWLPMSRTRQEKVANSVLGRDSVRSPNSAGVRTLGDLGFLFTRD